VDSFGISPAETVFEDYRDVNGVKMPFSVIGATTADRIQTKVFEMQANSPIDPSKFEPRQNPDSESFRLRPDSQHSVARSFWG